MSIPDQDVLTIAAAILAAGDREAAGWGNLDAEVARDYVAEAGRLQTAAAELVAERLFLARAATNQQEKAP